MAVQSDKAIGVAGLSGVFPDILEPATNPNHRKFMHSAMASLLSAYGGYGGIHNSNISSELKETILAASIGYTSHLLLDSRTPKGLPIV